ncbi:Capsular polysaccharide biosynthesis protein [Bacillus cereus R309803]|nr:Capsular polysaccharide biosynthesis protein [Bacillus cereus R309803]
MNSTAIFNGIKRIIDDENLRGKLTNNLSEENLGTESEIEKIYELIESY